MINIKYFEPTQDVEANSFLAEHGNANGTIAFTSNGIYVTYEDGILTEGMKKTILFNKILDAEKKKVIVEADYNRDMQSYNLFTQEVTDLQEKITNSTDGVISAKLKNEIKTSKESQESAYNQMMLNRGSKLNYDREINSCKLVLESLNHA